GIWAMANRDKEPSSKAREIIQKAKEKKWVEAFQGTLKIQGKGEVVEILRELVEAGIPMDAQTENFINSLFRRVPSDYSEELSEPKLRVIRKFYETFEKVNLKNKAILEQRGQRSPQEIAGILLNFLTIEEYQLEPPQDIFLERGILKLLQGAPAGAKKYLQRCWLGTDGKHFLDEAILEKIMEVIAEGQRFNWIVETIGVANVYDALWTSERSDTPPLLRRLINEYPEWKEQIVKGMVSRGGLSGLSAILSEFNTPFGTASGTTIQWNTEEKFLTGLFLIENSPVPVERLLLVLPAVLSQWETAKWDAKTPSLMLIRCLEEMASQDFNKVGLRPMASGRVYADFLPLLESARKTGRADSIACIARFFRKIAADPKLDPAQKEALHDAIIAGLNHADPEVRAAFNQIHFKEYLPGKPPPAGVGSSGALGLALAGIGTGLATFLGSDGAHAAVEASAHVFSRGDLSAR